MVSNIVTVDDNHNHKLLIILKKTQNNSDSKFNYLKSRNSFNLVIYNFFEEVLNKFKHKVPKTCSFGLIMFDVFVLTEKI
jgi:hypothetical protein